MYFDFAIFTFTLKKDFKKMNICIYVTTVELKHASAI